MIKIDWKRKAAKQLGKLPKQEQVRIVVSTDALQNWPDCSNVKKLTNFDYDYRLRVGRYRVFFNLVEGEVSIIEIEEVKKRDERTY